MRLQPRTWAHLMRTAMTRELSWAGPAREYSLLYERLLAAKRAGLG
jgi:glycogen synthase